MSDQSVLSQVLTALPAVVGVLVTGVLLWRARARWAAYPVLTGLAVSVLAVRVVSGSTRIGDPVWLVLAVVAGLALVAAGACWGASRGARGEVFHP